MSCRPPVRPLRCPLTEDDARQLLAKGILPNAQALGPKKLGLAVGCDEKTIRKARDEQTTLRLDNAFNLLLADPSALDHLLGHFGLRAVPIETDEDASFDEVARIAAEYGFEYLSARDPDGDGGPTITHREKGRLRSVLKRLMRPALALLHREAA